LRTSNKNGRQLTTAESIRPFEQFGIKTPGFGTNRQVALSHRRGRLDDGIGCSMSMQLLGAIGADRISTDASKIDPRPARRNGSPNLAFTLCINTAMIMSDPPRRLIGLVRTKGG
jgi:hypothetical protein